MPRPFQRPSTSLSTGEKKRVWAMVPANKLRPGDTVPDVGLVTEVFEVETLDHDVRVRRVVVNGGNNNQKIYDYSQLVKAFVAA